MSASEPDRVAAAAGASVTDLVGALLNEAERKADSIVARAEEEAGRIAQARTAEADALMAEALSAAREVLERVAGVEERLGVVVTELREEAMRLPSGSEELAEIAPREPMPPNAVPGVAIDVGQLAANLRSILDRDPPPASLEAKRERDPESP